MSRWPRLPFTAPRRARQTSRLKAPRTRLWLNTLEDRAVPALLTVDTLVDENDGYNVGGKSLREAIIEANTNVDVSDTINIATTGTITLNSAIGFGTLAVTGNMDIIGPGAANLTVAGDLIAPMRIFKIDDNSGATSITVSLSGLTVSKGTGLTEENGAGLFIANENVTIDNAAFTENVASTATTTIGGGGAIFVSNGKLVINNSSFTNNSTLNVGAAVNAFDGGAVLVGGTSDVSIGNCTFTGNGAADDGGALASVPGSACTITVNQSKFESNFAVTLSQGQGGAIYIGSGGAILNVTDSTVTLNQSTDRGGSIRLVLANATFTRCVITGNSGGNAMSGAGMAIYKGTTLIDECTISGNTTTGSGSYGGTGGGLYFSQSPTNATIRNSTISGNVSSLGGGGIRVNATFGGTLLLQHTTVANNTSLHTTSTRGNAGGGISRTITATGAAIIRLENSVVAGNFSPNTTPANILSDFSTNGTIEAQNSVLGANTAGAKLAFGIGNLVDLGGNTGFVTDPLLGALGPNGGPTETHVPLDNSPLRDNGGASTITTDQRGFTRVGVGSGPDIGSTESLPLTNATSAALALIPTITAVGAPQPTFTVNVTYRDADGVNGASIGTDDLTIFGPLGTLLPTGSSTVAVPGGVVATYTFTTPGGNWDGADNGAYDVQLTGTVQDSLGNPVTTGSLGMFGVFAPGRYVVDLVTDEDDGDLSKGDVSLRDAIKAANADANTPFDEIVFDTAGVFAGAQTITLTLNQIVISSNVNIIGTGKDKLAISGNFQDRIFNMDDGGKTSQATINLSDLTLRDGKRQGTVAGTAGAQATTPVITDRGGAINIESEIVNITNCRITNNEAKIDGGAINLQSNGTDVNSSTLVVVDSELSNNRALGGTVPDGGVLNANTGNNVRNFVTFRNCVISGNTAGRNGGVAYMINPGNLTFENCTVSGNQSNATNSLNGGGALYLFGSSPNVFIRNSTMTGNKATSGGSGGALAGNGSFSGKFNIENSTIVDNSASTNGGGINVNSTGKFTLNVTNSIIAKNSATKGPDIAQGIAGPPTINFNYSLLGNSADTTFTPGTGSLTNVDPLLSALGNYGGPTQTYLLLPGSPARDAGDPAYAGPLTTDQRGAGFPRIVDGRIDMGATESDGKAPAGVLNPIGPIVTPGATPNSLTVTYSDNSAIAVASIDTGDIEIVAPDTSKLTITKATVDINTDGTPRTVTYEFAVPGGTWGPEDNGTYTVNVVGLVLDDTNNPVIQGKLGTFSVSVPTTYVVDITADEDDGNTGPGDLSLREAVKLANLNPGSDIVAFHPAVFSTPQTIGLTLGQIAITDSVDVVGPGANLVTVNANQLSRLFAVDNSSAFLTVNLKGMTLTGGRMSGESSNLLAGGAVLNNGENLTLTNMVVTGNQAARDGGAFQVIGGALNIVDSVVSFNRTTGFGGDGGAIHAEGGTSISILRSTITGNSAFDGGGVLYHITGVLTIDSSTLSNNRTGHTPSAHGGAILFSGAVLASVVNSTITGNVAGQNGGAIYMTTANITITSSTIAGNTALNAGGGDGGGGGISRNSGTSNLILIDSVVAGNKAANGPDMRVKTGAAVAGTNNFVGDPNGVDVGFVNFPLTGDPLLGAATNNGGPTFTMLPAPNSPLRNAASGASALDQRGTPRPIGGVSDIGAVESDGTEPVAIPGALPDVTVSDGTPYTVTVTYHDLTSIDTTKLSTADIEFVTPTGSVVPPNLIGPLVPGAIVTATYSLNAPGGTWDKAETGTWTVRLKDNEVFGTGGVVKGATLGTFQVRFARNLVVTNSNDSGVGSLRQAIASANEVATVDGVDTISFAAGSYSIALTTGDLDITDSVNLVGPGAGSATINGNGANRIFNIVGLGAIDVVMSGLTLTGGKESGINTFEGGGAIYVSDENLTLNDMVLTGNQALGTGTAGQGGAVMAAAALSLTINRSTISGNTAANDGGGVRAPSNSAAVSVLYSTVSGNVAGDDGGGLYIGAYTTATVRNSTISGNKTTGVTASDGGGIATTSTTNLSVLNSTVAFNEAAGSGGGIQMNTGTGSLTIESTIVSNNKSADNTDITTGNAVVDTNLLVTTLTGFTPTGAPIVGDPLLAPLASNGGPTQTHAITNTSLAYNKGSNPAPVVTFDQRGTGFNRTMFGTTDIGAFEFQSVATPAKVASVKIDDGTSQRSRVRSLTITFDQKVELPGTIADAFSLSKQGGGSVTLAGSVDGTGTIVTLTFTGGEVDFNSLKDGRYNFSIDATKVTTGGGTVQLDGDSNGTPGGNYVQNSAAAPAAPTNVWRLFGDFDGDNDVDTSDFAQFRLAFGGGTSLFDFDNDGDTDTSDFGNFRSRFGASV